MTKAELIDAIAAKTGLTKKDTAATLEAFTTTVKEVGNVTLVGFGTFKQTTRAARKGRNPQTGAEIQIAESTSLTFKASKVKK